MFVAEVPAEFLKLNNFNVVEESGKLRATWDPLDSLPSACGIQYGVKVDGLDEYWTTDSNNYLLEQYSLDLKPCETVNVILLPIVNTKPLDAYKVEFLYKQGNALAF